MIRRNSSKEFCGASAITAGDGLGGNQPISINVGLPKFDEDPDEEKSFSSPTGKDQKWLMARDRERDVKLKGLQDKVRDLNSDGRNITKKDSLKSARKLELAKNEAERCKVLNQIQSEIDEYEMKVQMLKQKKEKEIERFDQLRDSINKRYESSLNQIH